VSQRLIEVRGLSFSYEAEGPLGRGVLEDIYLHADRGEIVFVLGATGSGKSTLLQHLNGLLVPERGRVLVGGRDLAAGDTDLTEIRRRVGLVFQRPEDQLFERYVGDDVAYGPRLAGLEGRELRQRVQWAMEAVGLDFALFKDRPTFALSGGERRRAGLAGVLAMKPEVLLLDEPSAGLDPAGHEDLMERLAELRDEGMTLVIATHEMDDAASLADRLYVLEEGRVRISGRPEQVFADRETLASCGLRQPTTVALMSELRCLGVAVPLTALTVDEAERILRSLLEIGS
jgi:energy-coupling factor transporter ATPase